MNPMNTMDSLYEPEKRIVQVDGLRGLAILYVMLSHFILFPSNISLSEHIELYNYYVAVVSMGWTGVDLFFVISGFLITGILCKNKGTTNYFRNFYARRILRTFPLYYLSLFIIFFILPLFSFFAAAIQVFTKDQLFFWLHGVNYWLGDVKNFSIFERIPLNHFWSLSIEEQFYLIWPFIILFINRKSLLYIFFGMIGISFTMTFFMLFESSNTLFVYCFPLCRIQPFVVGSIIALFYNEQKYLRIFSESGKIAFGIGILFLICSKYFSATFFFLQESLTVIKVLAITAQYTLSALFWGCLMIFILYDGRESFLSKVFASKFFTTFGKYSYCLYVSHSSINIFAHHYSLADRLTQALGSAFLATLLYTLFAISLSLLLSLVSWNLFEKQILKLKRYFGRDEAVIRPVA